MGEFLGRLGGNQKPGLSVLDDLGEPTMRGRNRGKPEMAGFDGGSGQRILAAARHDANIDGPIDGRRVRDESSPSDTILQPETGNSNLQALGVLTLVIAED